MPKIEVEHRGILTEKKFKELNRFFRKEGKFLDKKDRFSIIYFVSKKKVKRIEEMKNVPIDLKLRITNKKTELGLKYGKWGGKDARKEFLFPINSRKNKNFPILKKEKIDGGTRFQYAQVKTKDRAEKIEKQIIKKEEPKFNIQGN